MRKEAQIPLFLWVATAIVAHAVGGGGATKVVERLEETLEIKSFASEVRREASSAGQPVEVSLLADDDSELEEDDATEAADVEADELPEPEDDQVEDAPPEEELEEAPDEAVEVPETDSPTPDEVEPEEEKEKPKELEKKPEPVAEKEDVPSLELKKQPPPVPNRRVAVDQHVEDQNQEDNPDARFAGEHANRVDEETQARITSTDGDTSPPKMGGPNGGVGEEPGNSDQTRIAQADDSPGRKDRVPGESGDDGPQEPTASAAPPPAQDSAGSPKSPAQPAVAPRAGQKAQDARAATQEQTEIPETISSGSGSFTMPRKRQASAAQKARRARKKRAGVKSRSKKGPVFGLGSKGRTKNGVNLNLTHASARAIIGADNLARIKKREGERRRSEHRGKWKSMGLEKWKPSIENYVASVKEGNQTALNTARVPFARYLNQIHQRLHHIFAHGFLGHLDQLPAKHPLNNMDMSTHVEIALSRQDGRIVKMGITKSSGVTAFDVGALESVSKAAPYGPPPGSIVSSDGNVYLHWEFHRKPIYACSTYFARPFIIDLGQKSAPPRVDPPPPPSEEKKKKKKREQRSGSNEKRSPSERTNEKPTNNRG